MSTQSNPSPLWSEARLQQEAGNWLNRHHRAAYGLFWHTPNGEQRDARVGARLKAMHVKAGVPDCFLALPRAPYAGLFVEFKTDSGALSPQQKTVIENLRAVGFRCEVVRSLDQFEQLVTEYLGLAA